MAAEEDAQRPADGRLAESMANGNSSNTTGGEGQQQAATAKTTEGRAANGVSVTAEDVALREDICYQIFGDVGPLIRDFSCAWDHKVVMHGRMYVTERRLCFYANFFGLEAKMSLRHEDVAKCNKGNSAIFIPNAIVVQDKSGKDFVFRAFWERDECHGLLEKLRVEAGELRAKAEAAEAERAGDDELSALFAPALGGRGEEGLGAGSRSWHGTPASHLHRNGSDGREIPLNSLTAATLAVSTSPPPSDMPAIKRGPSTLPRGGSLGSSSSASSSPQAAAPSSRTRDGTRSASPRLPPPLSTPPPPQRRRGTDMGELGGGLSSSLPSSPKAAASCSYPSSPIAATSRGRSYSLTPASSGNTTATRAAATGGAVLPRPTKLGLAFLGPEHDTPSPPPPPPSLTPYLHANGGGSTLVQQQQQRQQRQRPSPRMAAVITGAGQAGWGTPESCSTGRDSPNGRGGGGAAADAAAAEERDGVPAETDGNDPSRSGPNADRGGARQESGEEAAEKQQAQGGDGRKVGLVRRSSKLWSMMRWNGGGQAGDGVAGEEDAEADRKAMEEAIAAGGKNHMEVATAEFDVSVKGFYERFVADDAPYGLPEFHMSRGDWEVDAGEWQQQQSTTDAEGEIGAKTKGGGSGGVTRAIRFKTPLHITFMSSPGQVRTLKRQRSRFFGGQGCIVETQTTVEDRIPLSDNFHVEDRWIIRPAGDGKGEGSEQRCTATVTWRCVWHKFTVIKGLIEGKCRADVKSFNIAFLEGMRLHLLEAQGSSGGLRRRQSLRESLLLSASGGMSGSRRASRERSFSGRSLLSSFGGSEEGGSTVFRSPGGAAISSLGVQDVIKTAWFSDRYLPAVRVFSILFILYISLFWVRFQMRDGGERGRMAAVGGEGGGSGSEKDLMRLYGEWGRSSLALLDVRAAAGRLSDDLLQLDLTGDGRDDRNGSNGRGGRSRKDRGTGPRRPDEDSAAEQLLREIQERVSGISERVDVALTSLDATASQIRDATACSPSAPTPAAPAGKGHETAAAAFCDGVGGASGDAVAAVTVRQEEQPAR